MGISRKCSNSSLRVGRGPRSPSSTFPSVKCSQGSLWGLSSEDVPSSDSQKVTCLFGLCGFGHQTCLSWDLPQGQLQGHQHHVLLASLLSFQYSFPKHGQHLLPINATPWLPGGLYHVRHPSLRSENRVWFGSWAVEWWQQPHIGPLPVQPYLPSFIGSSSRRTEYLWWPFPSIWACRVVGWAAS